MSEDAEKKEYHFLVVDDQPMMLKLIMGMLRDGGYSKIASASTGKEALAIMKKFPVDFIIADWYMPNMSGVELLRAVKDDPAYGDIPFVLVTGETTKEKVKQAIEEGVDGYLIKPVSQDKMISTVKRILEEKSNPDN